MCDDVVYDCAYAQAVEGDYIAGDEGVVGVVDEVVLGCGEVLTCELVQVYDGEGLVGWFDGMGWDAIPSSRDYSTLSSAHSRAPSCPSCPR